MPFGRVHRQAARRSGAYLLARRGMSEDIQHALEDLSGEAYGSEGRRRLIVVFGDFLPHG